MPTRDELIGNAKEPSITKEQLEVFAAEGFTKTERDSGRVIEFKQDDDNSVTLNIAAAKTILIIKRNGKRMYQFPGELIYDRARKAIDDLRNG